MLRPYTFLSKARSGNDCIVNLALRLVSLPQSMRDRLVAISSALTDRVGPGAASSIQPLLLPPSCRAPTTAIGQASEYSECGVDGFPTSH
jgi:hypothetical protein